MRVRIIFSLNNRGASVPFHHQYLLANLVDELKEQMPDEFRDYNRYSFSGLKGQTKVGKSGLHFFSNKVTLVFTSPSQKFIDTLLVMLFKRSIIPVGNLHLTPDSVERENDPEFAEAVKYVCISPMVITGPNTELQKEKDFVSPTEDEFSDCLYESTMARMEVSGMFTEEEIGSFYRFQLVPDQNYLNKIRDSSKKFSRIYTSEHNGYIREIRGYTFPFTLYADPKVQQFIFECGLGEYADGGFGMVDIANTNPVGRAIPYVPENNG